MIAAAT